MRFELSETHQKIHAAAEHLADAWADRALEARRWPLEHGALHPELWRDFCDAGCMGMMVPRDLGGSDQGLLAFALVIEAMASRAVLPALTILTGLGTLVLRQNASAELRSELLPRVARGELTLGLAVTEAESGHNFLAMQTVAERHGDTIRLQGEKIYVLGADVADRLLVVGRSRSPEGGGHGPAGTNIVLVDPRAPGVEKIEIPMGGRLGMRQFLLRFDGLEVPASQLVGEEHSASAHMLEALDAKRALFCAWALGTTRYCLDRAVERASGRVVFGERPIGTHQAIQHPLAASKARLEAAKLLTWKAASLFDTGAPHEQSAEAVTMAKFLTAELAWETADRAVQTFGGSGFNEEEGLIQLYLDARAFRTSPISQEVALNLVAEHVLGLPASR